MRKEGVVVEALSDVCNSCEKGSQGSCTNEYSYTGQKKVTVHLQWSQQELPQWNTVCKFKNRWL